MSDSQNTGFGKFVPGFDFLQNLTKGAADKLPQMPNLASWIAPTLSVEELDKRISELKTVHFWLDQNSKALGATIQALEVQKMTLATLKGMNVNIGDMANMFKMKAAPESAAPTSKTISELAAEAEAAAHKVREASKAAAAAAASAAAPEAAEAVVTPTPPMVDPMLLWGALTQQFQNIAASALKEVGANAAMDATKNLAAGMAKDAVEATKKVVASVVKTSTPAKPAAKAPVKAAAKPAAKPAAKKTTK
ncbi:MAG: PhaM family polyhydroxyalkanoate granule multifunctional regulatory protein [Rhodoferax sp.]|uniref:PhaM family polyhydroxyalkanoate granule multifunctional regulatory protein n=1 Tax=Rhodoferax sp. TaxID=50421 RepID=UPI003018798D